MNTRARIEFGIITVAYYVDGKKCDYSIAINKGFLFLRETWIHVSEIKRYCISDNVSTIWIPLLFHLRIFHIQVAMVFMDMYSEIIKFGQ